MKLFFTYLKQRRKLIWMLAVFAGIFCVTFFLYHLPLEALAYPMLLCLIAGLAMGLADFFRVWRKHEKMSRISALTDVLELEFAPPESIEIGDYQRLLTVLAHEQAQVREQWNNRYMEMVDYYTMWAHQIKTPIASMRLHLQNEDSNLSRQLEQDLFRVEQYVEMVLMFLKLDNGSSDYVIRSCRLDDIIRQSVKKYAGEFIARKLRLIYEPVDVEVVTDEKWLCFVVEQVLSNALKYTHEGSVTITVETGKKLCIQDTGIGIAQEDLPRIFENGYTGCNGRADKRASGIGLYLCQRICKNLGHRIYAQSEVDRGTRITIDLSQRELQVE